MEKEGRYWELAGDQYPSPKSPATSRKGQERRESERDVTRGATVRGTVKKSRSVRVIEGKEVGGDNTIEYFFPTRVQGIY